MTYQNQNNQASTVDNAVNQLKLLPSAASTSAKPKKLQQLTKLSLKTKAVLSAIALSVIPITIIGAIAHRVTANHITRQINQTQQERASHLADILEDYIENRAHEAETLASSTIFTNPNIASLVTINQKKAALNTFQEKTGFYDSIVYLDTKGNPLFQSKSEHPLRQNYGDHEYFQKAIASKKTVINEVGVSDFTGETRIEFAIPVKNAWTDQVTGVIRFRIPADRIEPLFNNYATKHEQWHLLNSDNIFPLSALANLHNQPVENYYPEIKVAHTDKKRIGIIAKNPLNSAQKQLIHYVPIRVGAINPQLTLGTVISINTDEVFASLKSLQWIFLGGTIGTVILVSSIASFLANHVVKTLSKFTSAIDQLGQGKLNTRIKLERQDELAILGNQINHMAEQLDISLKRQQNIARTAELSAKMSQARSTRELQLPFSLFLAEIRRLIKADRVFFYQFDPEWKGIVIAESVAEEFPRLLGVEFDDPCFANEYVRKYQRSRIHAVADLYNGDINECHVQLLEPYGIKASLVLPVVLDGKTTCESERLIGLLIANQCSETRVWEQSEIDYLQEVSYQLAMVLRGYVYYREDNTEKSNIEKDVTEVLDKLKKMAQGDLALELSSQHDSPSHVIQSFEELLGNMRQTIIQIKTPTQQINDAIIINQNDLADLKDKLRQLTNQLALIFAFMDQVSESVVQVSSQVEITSETINSVIADLELEKSKFGNAIAFMTQLEDTLRNNINKVKDLSSASQKMTRVITSIKKINLRASLLTSKLSEKIPQTDDPKFGLKEEIKSIQQSIAITQELENVIEGIDREITAVLHDYEVGEQQLKQENHLLVNADNNLEQIIKTTKDVQQYLLSLVNMTNIQTQTSQKIISLKDQLNQTSESIHTLGDRTINSLDKTAINAQDLSQVTSFFKLKQKAEQN